MLAGFEMASAITISATPAQVWRVFHRVQDWPRWSKVCTGVWNVSPELWDVGASFSFRLRVAGVSVPFSVRVIRSDPPHLVAWGSTRLTVTAVRTFVFEEREGGTIVTDHKRFTSPVLPLRLFYPRWIIWRMTKAWLRDLKAEAERQVAGP
ncbi:MAG: SRPBCC family protein [Chloroflexi bacterium]|nr:SRPBCC family protein [Chloroflexota bacterium]